MQLPGESSIATSWQSRQSAGAIVPTGNEVCIEHTGLTSREGLNIILLEIQKGARFFINRVIDSLENL
jgi:hypothetical protein